MHKINTLILALILFCCFLNISTAQNLFQMPAHATVSDYQPGIVLFKLKEIYRPQENSLLTQEKFSSIYADLQGISLKKNFPNAANPQRKQNKQGIPFEDLSLIYEFQFNEQIAVNQAVYMLQKSGLVEFAQPRFYVKPFLTPNDPQHTQQFYLNTIKAYEAWDITQGDTNITIGIVDGGIQFDHQDLMANIKYNYNDPINGIDDDGDGYIDNFRGWNFAFNNNDPTASLSPHGVFVSGIASATVNNGVGIAGVGFRSKYLSIRIDNAQGWIFGYEGIVYAADQGCQVINASWGNVFYSPVNEAVIRYATINKNSLVISAAGNSNLNEKYYPASYEYVINVAGTKQSDVKSNNSTFNTSVDICAPGEGVRSTWPFNGYQNSDGTSFAAPMVAAAAALLKAHKPQYNAIQLGERLKVTADSSIYNLPENQSFYHRLGFGRLNILRALTDPDKPSIVAKQIEIQGTNSLLQAGSQATISADFTNFLEDAENLTISLVSESPYFTVINPTVSVGSLTSLSTFNNQMLPFVIEIDADAPINSSTELKFVYEATGYKAYQYFKINANLDFMDLAVNHITTTITSKGDIGYNQPYQAFGQGFKWNDSQSLIFYSGLMVGDAPTRVSDNGYSATLPIYNRDFKPLEVVEENIDTDAALEIDAKFNDEEALDSQMNLEISQKAWAYNTTGNEDYIIKTYDVKNIGAQTLENVYIGNFTDWNIGNYTQNKAKFIPEANLVYITDTANSIFAGIKILNLSETRAYCLNADGLNGSISYYDGFSAAEKYQALTGADLRHETVAGDVATVVSIGPYVLEQNESQIVALAFIAGNNLSELIQSGNNAQAQYLYRNADISVNGSSASCNGNDANITVYDQFNDLQSVSLLNAANEIIETSLAAEGYDFAGLPAGLYHLKFNFNDSIFYTTEIVLDALPVVSAQIISTTTELVLPLANIDLFGVADNAEIFEWNMGNGITLEGQEVIYTYPDSGTYQITLIAYNASCADTVTLNITVIDTSTSVNLLQPNRLMEIYPNPFQEMLAVTFENDLGASAIVEILDLRGSVLIRQNLTSKQEIISTAMLSKGIYLISIKSEDFIFTKKLIKM